MLIKQSDYHRIYRVISSLITSEGSSPAFASMYFSTFGAFILKQHYKITATPKGGLAAYNLDGKLVVFADHRDDGYVTGAGENFHCWIEADGWAIDFMAPAFPELFGGLSVPSRMFQRPLSAMAQSINQLDRSGDFFYQSEPQATAERFADWRRHAAIGDLASIAANWFRRSPKHMQSSIATTDNTGKRSTIELSGNPLSGSW